MSAIYIDIYFFINFAIDFLSLFSVEKVMLIPESKKRCLIGAVIGAVYSVVHFLCQLPSIFHLPAAFIMVSVITYKRKLWHTLGGVAVFAGAEIFIGGCVYALKNLSDMLPRKSLVLSSFIILISVIGYEFYSLSGFILKKRLSVLSLNARLWHKGKFSDVILMIDSGNLVREFSTKKRVIFIKAEAIKNATGDADTLFEREKCYVIPIETASGKGSVMGFVPDKLEFSDEKYNEEEFIVVPDVRGGKFGGYDGIAPLL